ncbi:NADH-quinone oxidoreductase subunit N, partial [Campylobacter fetus]
KISDLNGLYKVRPTEAFAFTVICLSFIGFPYSVGFLGKLFIFSSAVESGKTYLAIFGIINTIFSVYYYLKIIISIYFSENKTALSCADSKKFGLKLLALSSILFIILEGSGIFSIISFLNLFIR